MTLRPLSKHFIETVFVHSLPSLILSHSRMGSVRETNNPVLADLRAAEKESHSQSGPCGLMRSKLSNVDKQVPLNLPHWTTSLSCQHSGVLRMELCSAVSRQNLPG